MKEKNAIATKPRETGPGKSGKTKRKRRNKRGRDNGDGGKIKCTYYLSRDIVERLEEVRLKQRRNRRQKGKPMLSKSVIVERGLRKAIRELARLSEVS